MKSCRAVDEETDTEAEGVTPQESVLLDPILGALEAHEISAVLEDCANQCAVLSIGAYQPRTETSGHSVIEIKQS